MRPNSGSPHVRIRFVAAHRSAVPARFAETISLHSHQRAADYTVARTRLAMAEIVVGAVLLVALTLLGLLQWLNVTITDWLGHGFVAQLALVAAVAILTSLVDLPFDYYGNSSSKSISVSTG